MKLNFNIEYLTVFGQELAVNISDSRKAGAAPVQYRMHTADGHHWTCEVALRATARPAALSYYYSVMNGDKVERREWAVVPHKLELTGHERYQVFDHWIDIPEDSYLYSAAFKAETDAMMPAVATAATPLPTVRLKVRAPQLRPGEALYVAGGEPLLGGWNPAKALPMVEHQINEWIADIDATQLSGRQLEFKLLMSAAKGQGDNVAQGVPVGVKILWEQSNNRTVALPDDIASGQAVVYELPQARFDVPAVRCAGTLVPVFSLRSRDSFGVGDFGDLRKMVEWVAQTGQRVLQVLPINDTTTTHTWTDSYPYSCISIFALHPQYADLRALPALTDATLAAEFETLRQELNALPQIDYERVNAAKTRYLRAVYEQEGREVLASPEFKAFFRDEQQWLVPYARYCHLRDTTGTADFAQWTGHTQWHEGERAQLSNARTRIYKEVAFYYYVQFVLSTQMKEAHAHARHLGVILKGDIPIGVNRQGCDVWSEPRYFNMNGQAGAPPDDFSADGQNWGFPTYNWDEMLRDGCQWWVRRFQNMAKYFDAYRIDHVLGFFRIWEIPVPHQSGLMGQFSPALALTDEEIAAYGIFGHRDLFLPDHKDPQKWHPRIAVQYQEAYQWLNDGEKACFNRLYNDYFYHRNNQFWYREAMKKLPLLVNATRMLVCAEDLGMVPDSVPWVMDELKILSLELQSMPKDPGVRFGHLSRNPYRSVCTISSHDMPTLRQWWDEDEARTQDYYNSMLHRNGAAPHPLPGWLARDILSRHLTCPSMLCILSIQDWLAMDERLRLPDQNAERINIPANPRHYWRYRMHLCIEDLMADEEFCHNVRELVISSVRL